MRRLGLLGIVLALAACSEDPQVQESALYQCPPPNVGKPFNLGASSVLPYAESEQKVFTLTTDAVLTRLGEPYKRSVGAKSEDWTYVMAYSPDQAREDGAVPVQSGTCGAVVRLHFEDGVLAYRTRQNAAGMSLPALR